MHPIKDLAAKITLREDGYEWSYHFYLWQSFKCFCLFVICVSYSSTVVKFLCGTHLQHLSGAAKNWNKRILSLLMWLPYAAATSFFIFNPVAWHFFLARNIWFRLEYSSIFLSIVAQSECQSSFRNSLLVLCKRQRLRRNIIESKQKKKILFVSTFNTL